MNIRAKDANRCRQLRSSHFRASDWNTQAVTLHKRKAQSDVISMRELKRYRKDKGSGRIVARLDRKRLGQSPMRGSCGGSEAFSISRLEGSRWRLRRAREMLLAMEFEWVFFRLLFGAKRECRHFQGWTRDADSTS